MKLIYTRKPYFIVLQFILVSAVVALLSSCGQSSSTNYRRSAETIQFSTASAFNQAIYFSNVQLFYELSSSGEIVQIAEPEWQTGGYWLIRQLDDYKDSEISSKESIELEHFKKELKGGRVFYFLNIRMMEMRREKLESLKPLKLVW